MATRDSAQAARRLISLVGSAGSTGTAATLCSCPSRAPR